MKFNSLVKQYNLLYETETFGKYNYTDSGAKPFIYFKNHDLLAVAKTGGTLTHANIVFKLKKDKTDDLVLNKTLPENFIVKTSDIDDTSKLIMGRFWEGREYEDRTPIGFWVESLESITSEIEYDYIENILNYLGLDPRECAFKFTSFYDLSDFVIYSYDELLQLYGI